MAGSRVRFSGDYHSLSLKPVRIYTSQLVCTMLAIREHMGSVSEGIMLPSDTAWLNMHKHHQYLMAGCRLPGGTERV